MTGPDLCHTSIVLLTSILTCSVSIFSCIPTGSGKTLLVKTLAKLIDVPLGMLDTLACE